MISGKLPNDTVWWLSKDGSKIWIESKDLEQDKFRDKNYSIERDIIFYARKDVGELAASRLDSRKGEDAWAIKLQAITDIYPELLEEINRKEIEENKKKRTKTSPKDKKGTKIASKKKIIEDPKKDIIEINKNKEPVINYFDSNRPYVTWIKDEISKNENGEMIIPIKDLKEKMGDEFIKLDNFRIYFGLNKILAGTGITVELGSAKKECIVIIKKAQERK